MYLLKLFKKTHKYLEKWIILTSTKKKLLFRDIVQRGRDLEGVLKQYMTHVKPAYQSYIAPCMAHADIIVPRGGENKVAIHLIVQHVHKQLQLVRTHTLHHTGSQLNAS